MPDDAPTARQFLATYSNAGHGQRDTAGCLAKSKLGSPCVQGTRPHTIHATEQGHAWYDPRVSP